MKANFNSLYRIINKFLSEDYAVIYAIEVEGIDIPKNQFVNHVYRKIRQSGLVEDAEDYIQAGALRIIDAREIYSSELVGDTTALLQKWMSIITDVRKSKFKNIAIIAGGTKAFSDSNNQKRLVAYEQAVLETAKKLQSVHIICCYLKESLDQLQFAQLVSVTNAHDCNIIPVPSGMESRRFPTSVILEAVVGGIEDILGKGSGRLIIQTMKAVYKIDENAIILNPSIFQEKLQKMLGNTSNIVLDSITNKIKETVL
jgi:DcmR-like sensory protein